MEQWIEEELECFHVGDERLHRRAKHILAGQCANPTRTFYASADSQAAAKATYRFQKNPAVNQQALLNSHVHRVKLRMADHPVVLCINDTTQLNFATQSAKENRGTLSSSSSPIDYLVHPLVAFTPNKICLGVLDCKLWSRPPQDYGKKHQRWEKTLARERIVSVDPSLSAHKSTARSFPPHAIDLRCRPGIRPLRALRGNNSSAIRRNDRASNARQTSEGSREAAA